LNEDAEYHEGGNRGAEDKVAGRMIPTKVDA